VHVEFETLESSEHFFRKVTLSASKQANLVKLAAMCREQAVQISAQDAEEWAEKEFSPHLSLFYGDVPLTDVKKKIPMIELQLGFEFGSLFDCCGGTLAMGARLALVETGKEIKDWELIAERELPWVMWKMARGLL
jgi:2',3'-cyclic-nucleotide 3'-phosphodiesterase